MKHIPFRILNLLPIFSVTCDDRFGAYSENSEKRFSLIRISLSPYKIYLISFCKNQFSFIKSLNIHKLRSWPDNNATEQKANNYVTTLSNDEFTDKEIDFLVKKTEYALTSRALLQEKISNYNTIALVILGYLIFIYKQVLTSPFNFIFIFFYSLIALNFYNLCYYILSFHKNRPTFRSSFSDVKSKNNRNDFAKSVYIDWYSSKEEKDVLATYVLNSEKYLKTVLLLLVVFSIVFFYPKGLFNKTPAKNIYFNEISLLTNTGDLNTGKLVNLNTFLKEALSNEKTKVCLIKNVSDNDSSYVKILNTLKLFFQEKRIEVLSIDSNYVENKFLILQNKAMED